MSRPKRPVITILYFSGCPNHPPAVEVVRGVVAELDIAADIEEVEVRGPSEAASLRFLGSPTIQVDGVDIEPAARSRTDFGFACRTYNGSGLPDSELLVRSLAELS